MARRRKDFAELFSDAVEKCSDCTPAERLRGRLAIALNPVVRRSVIAYVTERAAIEGKDVSGLQDVGIDLDNLERLLQILIEYAPQILAIVMQIIDLFAV